MVQWINMAEALGENTPYDTHRLLTVPSGNQTGDEMTCTPPGTSGARTEEGHRHDRLFDGRWRGGSRQRPNAPQERAGGEHDRGTLRTFLGLSRLCCRIMTPHAEDVCHGPGPRLYRFVGAEKMGTTAMCSSTVEGRTEHPVEPGTGPFQSLAVSFRSGQKQSGLDPDDRRKTQTHRVGWVQES